MLPAQYETVLKAINERFEKNTKNYLESITREQQRTQNEISILAERTMEWMETGIIDLTSTVARHIGVQLHGTGWGQRGFMWSQYFRQLCKDTKRPYVTFNKLYSYNAHARSIVISVPDRRYCDPLVSTFRLLAATNTAPVKRDDAVSSLQSFYLFKEEGAKLADEWRERCRVDPVFRKALRLPGA